MLEDFNPKIVETLAKTASLMRECDEAGENGESDEIEAELKVRELKLLPKTELYERLRGWLKRQRGDLRGIEMKHVEAIERLIHGRKSGKTAELPGRQVVLKQGGTLRFENLKVENSVPEH
jgi:hypothetical protein